jgi:ATP-dependent exoDNAse (exonuclease V) beta subunit
MSSTDGSHKVGIVTASAGTGKTYDLTSRIEAEIGAGRAPDRVLASTFTVKAAEELRERARERLISKGDAENAVRLLGARELNRSRGRFRGESFREAHLRPA